MKYALVNITDSSEININKNQSLAEKEVISNELVPTTVNLVDIPITPLVDNKIGGDTQMTWKRLHGKGKQTKKNELKAGSVLRKRSSLATASPSISKKSRDDMEVDNSGRTGKLAEVGEIQPRQAL